MSIKPRSLKQIQHFAQGNLSSWDRAMALGWQSKSAVWTWILDWKALQLPQKEKQVQREAVLALEPKTREGRFGLSHICHGRTTAVNDPQGAQKCSMQKQPHAGEGSSESNGPLFPSACCASVHAKSLLCSLVLTTGCWQGRIQLTLP